MCFATVKARLAISVAKLRKSPFCVLTYGIFFRVQGNTFPSAGEHFFECRGKNFRVQGKNFSKLTRKLLVVSQTFCVFRHEKREPERAPLAWLW